MDLGAGGGGGGGGGRGGGVGWDWVDPGIETDPFREGKY